MERHVHNWRSVLYMKLHLNIGLAPSILLGGTPLTASNVYDALTIAGFTVLHYGTQESQSELTAVAVVRLPDWCRDHQHRVTLLYSLAVVLRQEAIAWRYAEPAPREADGGVPLLGHLTGPHAAGWGDFDPAHFITPGPVGWTEVQS